MINLSSFLFDLFQITPFEWGTNATNRWMNAWSLFPFILLGVLALAAVLWRITVDGGWEIMLEKIWAWIRDIRAGRMLRKNSRVKH